MDGMISCPCENCVNSTLLAVHTVWDHLVSFGFCNGYECWFFHGEPLTIATTSCETSTSHVQETLNAQEFLNSKDISTEYGDIPNMMHDLLHGHIMNEFGDNNNSSEPLEEVPNVQQSRQGPNQDAQRFYSLLKDFDQHLYEGCRNFSKLSAIVILYQLKCLNGWSNKSFTMLLQILKDMLPLDAKLPKDPYEAKKIIKDLGLGYEKIDACINDCMLFWKENANDEECKVCHTSRWATNENDRKNSGNDKGNNGKGKENSRKDKDNLMNASLKTRKKNAAKVLCWFPLKPRLQRLFMSPKTVSSMKWHAKGCTNNEIIRHTADSLAWKTFDNHYVDFSSDPRNVRLGLAADGFNPFGNMSTSHSTWPVVLIPYNLPPWMCMKRFSFMLSLLIPGPSSPLNDIVVYLQPLIEELKELWDDGISTYDVSSNENFKIHAALMWMINDFPTYGDLFGWSTKGAFAYPSCNLNTRS